MERKTRGRMGRVFFVHRDWNDEPTGAVTQFYGRFVAFAGAKIVLQSIGHRPTRRVFNLSEIEWL